MRVRMRPIDSVEHYLDAVDHVGVGDLAWTAPARCAPRSCAHQHGRAPPRAPQPGRSGAPFVHQLVELQVEQAEVRYRLQFQCACLPASSEVVQLYEHVLQLGADRLAILVAKDSIVVLTQRVSVVIGLPCGHIHGLALRPPDATPLNVEPRRGTLSSWPHRSPSTTTNPLRRIAFDLNTERMAPIIRHSDLPPGRSVSASRAPGASRRNPLPILLDATSATAPCSRCGSCTSRWCSCSARRRTS